jgi:hypothetical protein
MSIGRIGKTCGSNVLVLFAQPTGHIENSLMLLVKRVALFHPVLEPDHDLAVLPPAAGKTWLQ